MRPTNNLVTNKVELRHHPLLFLPDSLAFPLKHHSRRRVLLKFLAPELSRLKKQNKIKKWAFHNGRGFLFLSLWPTNSIQLEYLQEVFEEIPIPEGDFLERPPRTPPRLPDVDQTIGGKNLQSALVLFARWNSSFCLELMQNAPDSVGPIPHLTVLNFTLCALFPEIQDRISALNSWNRFFASSIGEENGSMAESLVRLVDSQKVPLELSQAAERVVAADIGEMCAPNLQPFFCRNFWVASRLGQRISNLKETAHPMGWIKHGWSIFLIKFTLHNQSARLNLSPTDEIIYLVALRAAYLRAESVKTCG